VWLRTVTLGNVLGGVLFTGVALYAAYPKPHAIAPREPLNDAGAGTFVPSAGIEPV